MKRSAYTPTPQAIARAQERQREPRSRVSAVSDRTDRERAAAKPIRAAYRRWRPYCEPERLGASGACFGGLSVHEPWTRARGGPIDDPRNMATACMFHNTWISQSAAGIAFGAIHGMLVHAQTGPAWLRAGGRFPGMSREDALTMIGAEHGH